MRKCCVCGKPVQDGDGYEALGYAYHVHCFPSMPLTEKTRCYFCHKIMRKGDDVTSLGSIGAGGREDLVCEKCVNKHFSREKANERRNKKIGGCVRNVSQRSEACSGNSYFLCEEY